MRPGRGKGCDPLSRHQVLAILDEFVRLGKVPPLANANSFVGGYDVRIIYIVQDRRQPEEHYGVSGAKVLLNSCGVEMLFRTKDYDIAREVSERLGYDTVEGTSETKSGTGGTLAPKSSETVSDARRALLLPRADQLDWTALDGVRTLGLTAGASAPESLVQEMLVRLGDHYALSIEERRVTQEDVVFKLPAPLG